jgi:hypothetical protein
MVLQLLLEDQKNDKSFSLLHQPLFLKQNKAIEAEAGAFHQ